jgi:signal transduction histidine kinase/ActR/RegA family two-component response regulator
VESEKVCTSSVISGYDRSVVIKRGMGVEHAEATPAAQLERQQRFLVALERVNRIILAAPTLEAMLTGVLDEMLELFACDRAWLLFPCDPLAKDYTIPMERTRPEWPGAGEAGIRLPIGPFEELAMSAALRTSGACRWDGVHSTVPLTGELFASFSIKSLMHMAIRPRSGAPWCLGIHHCASAMVYEDDHAALLEAIGARLADGLTGFVALRASIADRRRLEQAQRIARLGSYEWQIGAEDDAYWSKELYRLLGLKPGEQPRLFSSVLAAIHPDNRARVGAIVGAVMKSGGEYDFQATAQRPDGEEWIMHAWGQALVGADGQVLSMMGVAQDVTERVTSEEHRRRLEAQLRQSQKMEAVGQLTGGVAHDFNNLLTVILGNLDELAEVVDGNPQGLALLGDVRAAATKAAELTQRLSAFSRQQPLKPSVVDVNRLLTNLEALLRRTLGASIAIEVIRGAGLWMCEVDPIQLESALLNLAVNARDAMPSGGRLTIETANTRVGREYAELHTELQPGQYVLVAVTDNGVGMTESVLSRAFDPFFTTKGPNQGTGLGLSMVYGFVKQSGGHVKLYSEPGEGTTAKIYLPRSLRPIETEERSHGAGRDAQGKGQLILVVEDEPNVRNLTVRMLERLGYRVLAAEDGRSALDIIQEQPEIELLFTDIVLPGGMNGTQLAQRVQRLRPNLPVLYTSGYTENAVIHHGRLDPGVDLLEKPFTRTALAQRIHEALMSKGKASEG